MRLIVASAVALALVLGAISTAVAGPATGTTTPLDPPFTTDTPVDVDVSITTDKPIVPFEYSIVNLCWFDGTYSGHYDSYERQDLNGPFFSIGGTPHTTATINLQLVPDTAVCKVFVVKGNTVLKGSTTPFDVD